MGYYITLLIISLDSFYCFSGLISNVVLRETMYRLIHGSTSLRNQDLATGAHAVDVYYPLYDGHSFSELFWKLVCKFDIVGIIFPFLCILLLTIPKHVSTTCM